MIQAKWLQIRIYQIGRLGLCLLLFTNLQAQALNSEKHSVLLLIDVSGSMYDAKIDSVKSATKRIIQMILPCNTEFAVMGFSGKKENPVPFRKDFSTNQKELFSFIDSLKPEGGTPLGAALKTACYYLKMHKSSGGKQTIILLSDGRSDDNIHAALLELKNTKSLVQCECIGYDIEYDKQAEEQLKQVARESGGEYYVALHASNVMKAFFKSGIKTIIRDVPVVVRMNNTHRFLQMITDRDDKLLINQNWMVDSIQINVSSSLYMITSMLVQENMQDTLPKSLVFDTTHKLSLFINNGSSTDANKKWVEGFYSLVDHSLTIRVRHYYFKLIVIAIDKQSLILCVNKFKSGDDNSGDSTDEICDCDNKPSNYNPSIYVYFSKAGCVY